jgi:hypothetical protein
MSPPGIWHPAGEGHTVLRAAGPCAGCPDPAACPNRAGCLGAIAPAVVLEACLERLSGGRAAAGRFALVGA